MQSLKIRQINAAAARGRRGRGMARQEPNNKMAETKIMLRGIMSS